jgi:hypothetical protein
VSLQGSPSVSFGVTTQVADVSPLQATALPATGAHSMLSLHGAPTGSVPTSTGRHAASMTEEFASDAQLFTTLAYAATQSPAALAT